MGGRARTQVHHQGRAEEQRQPHHPPPVFRQKTAVLQAGEQGPPEAVRLGGQQIAADRAEAMVGRHAQNGTVERRLGQEPVARQRGIIEPERMGQDVVEGGLHLGQQARHMVAGKGGIEEGKPRRFAPALVPHIGVVGIAMGGHAAGIRYHGGGKAGLRRLEQSADAVAVEDAVHAEAQSGKAVPIERQPRKGKALADIESRQPPTREAAGRRIDQALEEQPVDRLGRHLGRRDRVQRLLVDPQHLGIQRLFRSHRARAFLRLVCEIQRPQDIGKARIAAAAIDEDLLAREHRHQNRLVDRQASPGKQVGAVIFAAHRLLALLLVKLEEERAVVRFEEAVQRIQAVLVVIDRQSARPDGEQIGEKGGQHRLGALAVSLPGDLSDFGRAAHGCGHSRSRFIWRRADSGCRAHSGCRHRSAC